MSSAPFQSHIPPVSPSVTSGAKSCDTCKAILSEAPFRGAWNRAAVMYLRNRRQELLVSFSQSSCQMCHLLSTFNDCGRDKDRPYYYVWALRGGGISRGQHTDGDKLGPGEDIAECEYLILVHTLHDSPVLFSEGTIVNPSLVNYPMIRGWLEACRTDPDHQGFCSLASSTRPAILRLIDVSTRNIVPAPKKARYVALSYVWGGNPQTGFPQVVLDSMMVAKELGYLYLWVDKYCIDQEDSIDKLAQISNMHLVYGCADLTLIAAAGQDSSYGLPGVSGRSRIPQRFERLGEFVAIRPTPTPSSATNETHWATRGWTYQEAMLSRRRLIFTDYNVNFQCNTRSFCEGIGSDEPWGPFDLEIAGFVRDMSSRAHRLRLAQAISTYNTRHLSYESDRLNAILGVLGEQESHIPPIYHVWGAPVTKAIDRWALALGWSSSVTGDFSLGTQREPRERNPMFPSWSWTGWAGPAALKFSMATDDYDPPFKAWLAKDDNRDPKRLISLETFARQHHDFRLYSIATHYVKIEGSVGVLSLEHIAWSESQQSLTGTGTYAVIGGPGVDKLLRFFPEDEEFALTSTSGRKSAYALQVSRLQNYENTWFVLIVPRPDGSYRRIGSLELESVCVLEDPNARSRTDVILCRTTSGEFIKWDYGNRTLRESHIHTIKTWLEGFKRTTLWLS